MEEAYFWDHLESRLDAEFAGFSKGRFRNMWCDGIRPGVYVLDGASPRIEGICWIYNDDGRKVGRRTEFWNGEWKFTLLLSGPVECRAAIDWDALYPAEDVTGWMWLDERNRVVGIDPSAAVPRRSPRAEFEV
jgi:hypothetical protein